MKAQIQTLLDTLYTVRLTDSAITFYGVRDEDHVLDVIKDFVESGEVYM